MQSFSSPGIVGAFPPVMTATTGGSPMPLDAGAMPGSMSASLMPPGFEAMSGGLPAGFAPGMGMPMPPGLGLLPSPGTLLLGYPGALLLEPGLLLQGEVTSQTGDQVTLRFGEQEVEATTSVPLAPGQQVDLQVQGQENGTWSLQVVGSQLYEAMGEGDLSSALMQLGLPVQDSTMAVARSLLEQGLPLTRDNFQAVATALQQLPTAPTESDLQAATFLRAGNLPLTPDNVTTLASFLTQQPYLGAQMFAVQQTFRRLVESDSRFPREVEELLSEVPGLLGEMVVDTQARSRRRLQAGLRNMAFQTGIETLGEQVGGFGDGNEDYLKWLRFLADFLEGQEERFAELRGAHQMLGDLAENLAAQRLINSAAAAEQGSFYMQVPLREEEQTAQVRLLYHKDSNGRPRVSGDDTALELSVPTVNLGDVAYAVTVQGRRLTLDVAVADEFAAAQVERYLPVLVDNLGRIGYDVQGLACRLRDRQGGLLQPIMRESLEQMERVDISA